MDGSQTRPALETTALIGVVAIRGEAFSRSTSSSWRRRREISRRWRIIEASVAVTPIRAPAAKVTRITNTKGSCHWMPKKKFSVTRWSFLIAKPNKRKNSSRRMIQMIARMTGMIPER